MNSLCALWICVSFLFGIGCAACYVGWKATRPLAGYRTPADPLRAVALTAEASAPARGSVPPIDALREPKRYELKIIQCSDPFMWYAKKVGKRVVFLGCYEDGYWSREDAGYKNIVKREDAIIVAKEI